MSSSDLNASLKYRLLDFNKIEIKKASRESFTTLVQNALLNCTNVLLQSKTAELCNEGFLCAEVVFGNFICSLSLQDQSEE